ncbi:unnamed protein product [Diatraea saccharalis]|uniref:RING-type domain-containing protein n=1 Tax=Diatraea saccharalis TaxID=40085 RepID=A0A9N9QY77_9NEOP|nr:unnamed protein product [Diatraea saccharalis]
MSNFVIPVDRVVDLVKNLLDGTRCPICDTSVGNRIRYPCGHIGCTDCVTEGCTLCLTPPIASAAINTVDEPFTKRVKNANSLLNICQETFNVDVYKYRRISEQLKIEKDLFPECIQAPVKYSNKRKSLISNDNKENYPHLLFPGENVSPKKQIKMKKHGSFLNQWLDENVTHSRKVFSELNVNQQSNIIRDKKVKDNLASSRKRIQTYSHMRQYEDSLTKKKKYKTQISENKTVQKDNLHKKQLHEDSGIFIDDESICIQDGQSEIVDKDKLAFLAVEQADKEDQNSISFRSLDHRQESKSEDVLQASKSTNLHHQIKVPFYKKSYLLETCAVCKETESFHYEKTYKNVSVSLESNDFITTIKISDVGNHQKKSVGIQTDINSNCSEEKMDVINSTVKKNETISDEIQIKESQDIFIDDSQLNNSCDIKKKDNVIIDIESDLILPRNKTVIIEDSDSDTTNEESTYLHVSADVHVSCEPHDYGILSEINTDESICRSRNKVRGATPDSSNSSEKENCDPNKIKKIKGLKKPKSTKKMYV